MKFCRFSPVSSRQKSSASIKFGLIEGDSIREISAAPWKEWKKGLRSLQLKDCRLAAPVLPSKIVCVGRNYAAHAAEPLSTLLAVRSQSGHRPVAGEIPA